MNWRWCHCVFQCATKWSPHWWFVTGEYIPNVICNKQVFKIGHIILCLFTKNAPVSYHARRRFSTCFGWPNASERPETISQTWLPIATVMGQPVSLTAILDFIIFIIGYVISLASKKKREKPINLNLSAALIHLLYKLPDGFLNSDMLGPKIAHIYEKRWW